jgi:phosphoesterase RecJ-like protein
MPGLASASKSYQKQLTDFCNALKRYDNFLLACHVLPEGDAIGSILAMDSLLRRLGKKTTIAADDDFPKRIYCFSSKRWNRADEIKKPASSFQAIVLADCANLDRIGKVKNLIGPKTVIFNIDHHVSNDHFGEFNCVNPQAAASGEVVYDIFKKMRVPIRKEEAQDIYVTLSTDTGSFKYGNTTQRTFKIASELLATGLDLEKISQDLYDTFSINKIQLYSTLFGKIKTKFKGRVAWGVMERKDLHRSGAIDEDMEGFVDFIKSLREVNVAFFLSETSHGLVRVSFRSKGPYDVNKLAASFNGGGHKKASGCMLKMTLQEAEKNILQRIGKFYSFS